MFAILPRTKKVLIFMRSQSEPTRPFLFRSSFVPVRFWAMTTSTVSARWTGLKVTKLDMSLVISSMFLPIGVIAKCLVFSRPTLTISIWMSWSLLLARRLNIADPTRWPLVGINLCGWKIFRRTPIFTSVVSCWLLRALVRPLVWRVIFAISRRTRLDMSVLLSFAL